MHVKSRSIRPHDMAVCQYTRNPQGPKQKFMAGFIFLQFTLPSTVEIAVSNNQGWFIPGLEHQINPGCGYFHHLHSPLTTIQVKQSLCLITHNATDSLCTWRGGITPRILDFGAAWLYTVTKKHLPCQPDNMLCGPQSLTGRGEHKKTLCLETKPDSPVRYPGVA